MVITLIKQLQSNAEITLFFVCVCANFTFATIGASQVDLSNSEIGKVHF